MTDWEELWDICHLNDADEALVCVEMPGRDWSSASLWFPTPLAAERALRILEAGNAAVRGVALVMRLYAPNTWRNQLLSH